MSLPELDVIYNLMNKMEQRFSEAHWLLQEVKKMNPKKILEIGTARGATAALLAITGATVYTIDKLRCFNYSWKEEWYRENFPSAEVISIIGDSSSQEVIRKARSLSPFDFIFIDGDHTRGVWWDWRDYSGMGRYIGLHDIINYDNEPPKVWAMIKERFPGRTKEIFCERKARWGGWWGFEHGGGIGIVRLC